LTNDWLMLTGAAAALLLLAAVWGLMRVRVLRARLEQAGMQIDTLEAARREADAEAASRQAAEATLATRLEARDETIAELKREAVEHERQLGQYRAELGELRAQGAELGERLVQERRAADEKLALLEEARSKLSDAFKALSSDALERNNASFLKLAQENLQRFQEGARGDLEQRQKAIEQLTQPIRERLEKFDGKLDELEKARHGAYRALTQQVDDLLKVHLPQLHRETADLVKALRQPQARGRWGEMQLRRVVEMAGMLEHCDFDEQVSQTLEGGNRLRPDLIVHLPGGRQVVVDAKAPVEAYLEAVEAPDEAARSQALVRHARQVRDHIAALGKKAYFDQFDPTPEFVVLFVPGEAFFSAALAQDPTLIEYGAESRVIPASPTTLIALLKAVAYGWRQEALAQNAAEVAALGKELYDRLATLADHWGKVGQRLNQAVDAYNSSVGTLERRVLPSARKFRDLQAVAADREIDPLAPLTQETRPLTAPEMLAGTDATDSSGD
jgi:DNA recombination protein RmuC